MSDGDTILICAKGACIEGIYTRAAYTGSGDAYIRGAGIGVACVKGVYIGSIGAVKCSGMHLQSF